MFIYLVLFSFLCSYCLTIKNSSYNICQKIHLCRNKIEPCYPIVMKCRNGSCHYRSFNINNTEHWKFSRWFYDSNHQRCRRNNNQIENFVYFRFLRDCRRLCPIIRPKKIDRIVTLHVSHKADNYNDTVYVHLYIDLSPKWIQNLADSMNISTQIYNSQVHYFQNYRRHFTNFIDSAYQLMSDHQRNIKKKNYS